jgi:ClpP class serine protease
MLKGEYLLIKSGFLKEYAARRFGAQKNINSPAYQDFAANRFEQAMQRSRKILTFEGVDAIVSISGPLSIEGPDIWDLYDGIGGCSYLSIQDSISQIQSDFDPTRGKVIFRMNTPGGTVDGCDATFQAIWQLSQTHDVEIHNMGLIASAGEWLASAGHRVIAKTPVAMQGSIGVVLNTFDFTGMLENMGIEEIVITNFESADKIPDLKTEKGKEIVIEELNAIHDVFVDRVLQGRQRALAAGAKKISRDDINGLKGRVLIAQKAIEVGLTDSIEDVSSAGSEGSGVSDSVKQKSQASVDKNKLKIEKENEENESKNNREGKSMKLSELLEKNPDAKAEHDASLAAEREKGAESVRAVITAAAPFIESDSYPAAIKTLALKTIKGDTDAVALIAAVAAVDAAKEGTTSATVQDEVTKQPETAPTAQANHEDKKGKVETIEDYSASVNNLRHLQGMAPLNTGGAS